MSRGKKWDSVEIGKLGEIITGNTPSKKDSDFYIGGTVPFVKPNNIDTDTICRVSTSDEYINNLGLAKARVVDSGAVLVTCIGTIGKVGISSRRICFNQQINAIVPFEDKCTSEYLAYAIQYQKKYLSQMANASVVPIINKSQFSTLTIPLPPLSEQKRIAAILDIADSIRTMRQTAIAKLDQLAQSVFLEMFGDPNSNAHRWDKITFSEYFSITTGKLDANAMVEGGRYPFFTCAKEPSTIDTFSFDQEALLLAGNNAAGVYDVKHYIGKFNAYQRTYVLTLRDSRDDYLFARKMLENQLIRLQQKSKGINTKFITLGILEELPLFHPSHEIQAIFSKKIETLNDTRNSVMHAMSCDELLFSSLQSRAFAGDL